jgi:hypothetical protein
MNFHYNWLAPFQFRIFATTYTGSSPILNLVIIKLNPLRGSDFKAHVWSNSEVSLPQLATQLCPLILSTESILCNHFMPTYITWHTLRRRSLEQRLQNMKYQRHTECKIQLLSWMYFVESFNLRFTHQLNQCLMGSRIWIQLKYQGKKVKAIPVTHHGWLYGCETSRFPHFLDNWLRDGGKVVSPMRRPTFTPQEDSWYWLKPESITGP